MGKNWSGAWSAANAILKEGEREAAVRDWWRVADLSLVAREVSWGARDALGNMNSADWGITLRGVMLASSKTFNLKPLVLPYALAEAVSVLPIWEEWAAVHDPEHLNGPREALAAGREEEDHAKAVYKAARRRMATDRAKATAVYTAASAAARCAADWAAEAQARVVRYEDAAGWPDWAAEVQAKRLHYELVRYEAATVWAQRWATHARGESREQACLNWTLHVLNKIKESK